MVSMKELIAWYWSVVTTALGFIFLPAVATTFFCRLLVPERYGRVLALLLVPTVLIFGHFVMTRGDLLTWSTFIGFDGLLIILTAPLWISAALFVNPYAIYRWIAARKALKSNAGAVPPTKWK